MPRFPASVTPKQGSPFQATLKSPHSFRDLTAGCKNPLTQSPQEQSSVSTLRLSRIWKAMGPQALRPELGDWKDSSWHRKLRKAILGLLASSCTATPHVCALSYTTGRHVATYYTDSWPSTLICQIKLGPQTPSHATPRKAPDPWCHLKLSHWIPSLCLSKLDN